MRDQLRLEPDRHVLDSRDEVGPQSLNRARKFEIGYSSRELFDHDF